MSSRDSLASNLVAVRGNRCSATILSFLESNVYAEFGVSQSVQNRVRRAVLDAVNAYKDLAIDIVKADDAVMNDLYVETVGRIHDELADMRRMLGDGAEK